MLDKIWNEEWGTCTERSRKACGIATLRAQPLVEKYGEWGMVISPLLPLPPTPSFPHFLSYRHIWR
jgi:uncharacterized membrane protein